MMKDTIKIIIFILLCLAFLSWRLPAYCHETMHEHTHHGHAHGTPPGAGAHVHSHGEHKDLPATGDKKLDETLENAGEEEHEHTSEMEFFHQEYFNEPWRITATVLPLLKKKCLVLAGAAVVLFLVSAAPGFLRKRRNRA